jgi:hypothetical protein
MIKRDHVFWTKISLSQIEEGGKVFLSQTDFPSGTVHDTIFIKGEGGAICEMFPKPKFRFLLSLEADSNVPDSSKPTYRFRQLHEDYTCYLNVRADEIAALIEKEEDPL